jgi:hypothetical protein
MKANTPIYLTSEELAHRLRLNENTPKKWRMLGKGPRFIKAGNNVLYPLSEVESWEQSQLYRSTAEVK